MSATTIEKQTICKAAALVLAFSVIVSSTVFAAEPSAVTLPGDAAYPESISAASDGTLYASSLASGGIFRVKPGASAAEQWIKPGAFDSRSTFGVLVDEKAGMLLVCSNDISALGVPGPGEVKGSFVKGFDLKTGEGKLSVALPKAGSICNDFAIAPDGSIFLTNSSSPQILRLKPGSSQIDVWLESADFNQPKEGAGLDGIAFGSDGNLYVNTYANGEFFRVDVKDGAPGKITKLKTSRPLKFADGLRPADGDLRFIMAEGGGSIDHVTIKGDEATIETIKDGLAGPTAIAHVGDSYWTTEGQLSHLFDSKSGPPHLPFRLVRVPAGSSW
jgi:sugar lactone lactonase YvrE